MENLNLFLTLWPTFPHYERFAQDFRVAGIRLNGAMIQPEELSKDFGKASAIGGSCPLLYDVKGRQLRVEDVGDNKENLELKLNRKIAVPTPTPVLFKAGEDYAVLERIVDGDHLIFRGGPYYNLAQGESLHILHPELRVFGDALTDVERKKTEIALRHGFSRFLFSYTESQRDIDEFREVVGDAEVIAKIENRKGLAYVATEFEKHDHLSLMAACGDLFVEVKRPHQVLCALQDIIRADPHAYAGSRILLSLVNRDLPSFADLGHLGWLVDQGYKNLMLCDDLCLKEESLAPAITVVDEFRKSYQPKP